MEQPMTDLAEHDRLLRELTNGPLRDEMFPPLAGQDQTGSPPAAEQPPATTSSDQAYRLQFTGDGAEYFRIWIVNLVLTIATLGIYSAWAKVRKTRYFWQNTRLDGHVFDYHGAPWAILRGRILALVLLAAYTWAIDISRVAGLVTIGVLCATGPWLFWKAQQFKFRNTSYRGVRFDFGGGLKDAYVSLLPLLLIWFSGPMVTVLVRGKIWPAVGAVIVTFLLFPWMHRRLKSYQHGRARFGDQSGRFDARTGDFYWIYVKGIGVLIGATVLAIVVGVAFGGLLFLMARADPQLQRQGAWAIGLLVFGVLYLGLWPYFAARVQRLVWDKTGLGPLRFRTTMSVGSLFAVVAKSMFWTVLTLGLYWPYAAIRLARYRVQCMEVLSEQPLDQIARSVHPAATVAAGDSAADLFGLDIGL
jgi:uncharacterized membrane protein YjgN (DUF898 family)